MSSSVTKKIYGSASDVISNLPDAILENILTRVSLQDAVKTSVLSKRWRYSWATLQQVVFDDTMCKVSPNNQLLAQQNKMLVIVYQVLHRIQTVRKFCLSYKYMKTCPEIDNLIIRLSSTGIEEFTLHLWMGEPHKLPLCLFSYQKLSRLDLRNCAFSLPATFRGFSTLVSLELVEVSITEDSLARLISSCPLLENLKFEISELTTCGNIEIDSSSLKVMHFIGTFKSVCFKNAPHLATFSLCSKVAGSPVEPNKGDLFYCKLPALENLELDGHYVKSLSAGTLQFAGMSVIPIPGRLKDLKLDGVDLDIPLECGLALLLMLSPNVQILRIKVTSSGRDTCGQHLVQGWQGFYFEQLRDVHVDGVHGSRTEIAFLKSILTKSRVLEKMVINPLPGVADKGFAILKELSLCERLSLKAKIII